MESLNKIELRGVVGSVKAIKSNGNKVVKFTLATNFAVHDTDGCAFIETSWHNIIAQNIIEADAITKGEKVEVLGRIRYNHYTGTDGIERISSEVVASKINILGDLCLDYQM